MESHLGEDTMDFIQVICLQKHVCVWLFFYYLKVCDLGQLDVELYTVFASSYTTYGELWKSKKQWSLSI